MVLTALPFQSAPAYGSSSTALVTLGIILNVHINVPTVHHYPRFSASASSPHYTSSAQLEHTAVVAHIWGAFVGLEVLQLQRLPYLVVSVLKAQLSH